MKNLSKKASWFLKKKLGPKRVVFVNINHSLEKILRFLLYSLSFFTKLLCKKQNRAFSASFALFC